MRTAIGVSGESEEGDPCRWKITIHFDDNSDRVLGDVVMQPRKIMQLAKRPNDYPEILGVPKE